MDIGSVGKDFVQFILLVTSLLTGTFHSSNEPLSSVPHEQTVVDTTYPYLLHGPLVYEATASYELNSFVVEKSGDSMITPTLAGILPTVTYSEKLKPIITTMPTATTKPTSTLVPTNQPTATPTPTVPKPTKTPIPESVPTITESSQISLNIPAATPSDEPSLSSDVILQLINDHRAVKKLSPYIKDAELCRLAEYRKPQLYDEIFTSRKVHKGLYDLKLPYFITENMAHYPTEQKVVSWWLGSTIHRRAIEGNYTFSCGACSGHSCAQLFTSYTPKSY